MAIPMTARALILLALLLGAACSPDRDPRPARPPTARVVPTAPAPAAVLSPRPDARRFTDFRPSQHGFRFTNRFKGSPLPFSLGALEKYITVPNTFGLCGGMSFAAADYYLADRTPPGDIEPPEKDSSLYTYLYNRQLDSLGDSLAAVPRFARWMSLPDASPAGTGALTVTGLGPILQRIRQGEPAHLGLVLVSTRQGGKLWENHQVLGYAADPTPGHGLTVRIYDPNFPINDGAALHVTWKPSGPVVLGMLGTRPLRMPWPGAEVVRRAPGRRDTPVRGFFLMDYARRVPPAISP
jgi:hypothetical protein